MALVAAHFACRIRGFFDAFDAFTVAGLRSFGGGGLLLSGTLAGCGTPSFVVTPIANAVSLDETTVVGGSGLFPDKIALIASKAPWPT